MNNIATKVILLFNVIMDFVCYKFALWVTFDMLSNWPARDKTQPELTEL